MIDPELLVALAAVVTATPLSSYIASRQGAKTAFNGIYDRLDRHETKLDKLTDAVSGIGERVARLEAMDE